MNPGTQPNSDFAADPCSVLLCSYTLHCDLKWLCESGRSSSSRSTFRWLLLISFTAVARINTSTLIKRSRWAKRPQTGQELCTTPTHGTLRSWELCWKAPFSCAELQPPFPGAIVLLTVSWTPSYPTRSLRTITAPNTTLLQTHLQVPQKFCPARRRSRFPEVLSASQLTALCATVSQN